MMNPRTWAAAALAAMVLIGTACGDDDGDDEDTARIDSGQSSVGQSAGDAVTTTTEAGEDDDPGGDDPGGGDPGGGDDDNDDEGGSGSGATLQQQDLTVDVRHPNGVSVKLTRIGPEGDDVVIDAEVVNSSRQEVTFHQGNWSSARLRLVDDAGQDYNFVEQVQDEAIDLAPGESFDAKLAFRGPLHGEPELLYLVTNEYTENVETFDPEAESDSTIYPRFVIPIELEWG